MFHIAPHSVSHRNGVCRPHQPAVPSVPPNLAGSFSKGPGGDRTVDLLPFYPLRLAISCSDGIG